MIADLSIIKRLKLRIFGVVYIEHRKNEGWTKPLPFYLAKCPRHGLYEDYPHGYEGEIRCPQCHNYTIVGDGREDKND